MAREVRNRIAPNVSGRTNINRAAPAVQARAVDRTVVAPSITSAGRLAESLSAFSPGLNKYLNARHHQYAQDEMARGAQAASMSKKEFDEKIAKGEMSPEQSPWFQQAYMRQAGINAGQRRARELAEAYANPEVFNRDTGDIDEFLGNQINGDIEGLEDTDFKSGYLTALRQTEDSIRNDYTNAKVARVRQDVREQVYQSYFNTFEQMGKIGTYDPANLDVLAQNAQALNLEKSELNSIAFTAAATYALQGDGHPEVFELFKTKGKNGVASLYYTSDYGKQIEATQRQAASLRQVKQARQNNQLKFIAEQEWREKIKANGGVVDQKQLVADIFDPETNPQGRLSAAQAEEIYNAAQKSIEGQTANIKRDVYLSFHDRAMTGEDISEEARASDLTAAQIIQLEKIAIDRRAEIREQSLIEGAIAINRPDLLHSVPEKSKETYAQSTLNNALEQTQDLTNAMLFSLDKLKTSGVLPPQVNSLLKTATPQNAETWTEAVNVYRSLKSQAPVYLNQTFTDANQIARFDAFEAMTEYGGYTPDQAMEAISSMNKDDIAAGDALYGDPRMRAELYDEVADEFEGVAGFGGMRRQVESLVKARLRMPDHPEFNKDLLKDTIQRVKDRHVNIGGTWIDRARPGANVDGLDDAVGNYLKEWYQKVNPNVGMEPARIVPDEHTNVDGTWVILDQNGGRLPGRVNPEEFTTEWKIKNGDLMSQQEMKRRGLQSRYQALRKEIGKYDSAQYGLKMYAEEGKNDPRYIRNAEARAKLVEQLKVLEEELHGATEEMIPSERRVLIPHTGTYKTIRD